MQESPMLFLMMETAAARRRSQALPKRMLGKGEDPPGNRLVLTLGGRETGAPMPVTTRSPLQDGNQQQPNLDREPAPPDIPNSTRRRMWIATPFQVPYVDGTQGRRLPFAG